MKRNSFFWVCCFIGVFLLSNVILPVSLHANSLKSSIVGKWFNQKDNSEHYEFLKDGTVIIANGQESEAGNYKFLDTNRIKVDIGGWFGSKVFTVSIENGRMQLSEPTGKYSIYNSEKINPASLYNAGIQAFEQEKYKKAIQILDDAVQRGLPNNNYLLGAYLRLYMSAMILDDTTKTPQYYEKCKSLMPQFDITYSKEQWRLLKYNRPYHTLNESEDERVKDFKNVQAAYEARRQFNLPKGGSINFGKGKKLLVKLAAYIESYENMPNSSYFRVALLEFYDENGKLLGSSKAASCNGVLFPGVFKNYVICAFGGGSTPPPERLPWVTLAIRTAY